MARKHTDHKAHVSEIAEHETVDEILPEPADEILPEPAPADEAIAPPREHYTGEQLAAKLRDERRQARLREKGY